MACKECRQFNTKGESEGQGCLGCEGGVLVQTGLSLGGYTRLEGAPNRMGMEQRDKVFDRAFDVMESKHNGGKIHDPLGG